MTRQWFDNAPVSEFAQRSFRRIFPRLAAQFASTMPAQDWKAFSERLERFFSRLFAPLFSLYGNQYDFFYHLEDLVMRMARSWQARPQELKALDKQREDDTFWYQGHHMVGGTCYVDRFAGNLQSLRKRIPYFQELGLTYLHLMPLFKMPEGENDGGYAVSSYREVHPPLGTMEDLRNLAADLQQAGISLVLDFVLNHTSDEHEWAMRAKAGEKEYQEFYYIFPDRSLPDVYERTLREIFPEEHPGSFTFVPELNGWVWTTFHSYQWDLNYSNPAVFNHIASEMLFLANAGADVLRLDAVAFLWKRMGTSCENLPEAHTIIQALNAVARITAPALIFQSEAIVHPDEVIRYIAREECQLSYNPLLMALLWESLATRETRLLRAALRERFRLPAGCSWVNYVRCHDDIGWTFSDEDAMRLGINPAGHRAFLNTFYTGQFPGSFARGLPFQVNVRTGDARISGTCASLAGLEKALHEETEREVELAIRRILLIHGIILTIGGIPLIYLGDEIATPNDYSFFKDPGKARDSRWVHRPVTDWEKVAKRHDPSSIEGRVYAGIRRLIQMRKSHLAFAGQDMQVIDTDNEHLLGYVRSNEGERVVILANFSEGEHTLSANLLRIHGLGYHFTNLLNDERLSAESITLPPYAFLPLKCEGSST